jgi:uncharacterized protein (DUF983 family)
LIRATDVEKGGVKMPEMSELIAAYAKQQPQKVRREKVDHGYNSMCPACGRQIYFQGNGVFIRGFPKYCKFCGQRVSEREAANNGRQ